MTATIAIVGIVIGLVGACMMGQGAVMDRGAWRWMLGGLALCVVAGVMIGFAITR